jgi:hypothetical protein
MTVRQVSTWNVYVGGTAPLTTRSFAGLMNDAASITVTPWVAVGSIGVSGTF